MSSAVGVTIGVVKVNKAKENQNNHKDKNKTKRSLILFVWKKFFFIVNILHIKNNNHIYRYIKKQKYQVFKIPENY